MIGEGPGRSCLLALTCAIALLLGRYAAAQDAYPAKPIKLVVPLAAGGGIDFTARTTAQKLSEVLGQQVVVENQGGAGGTLGVNAVVRAAPDGYTLLYHSVTGVVSAVVGKDLPYDWLKDLAPVSLVTRFAPVLVINPSLPANDLKEFIALAKICGRATGRSEDHFSRSQITITRTTRLFWFGCGIGGLSMNSRSPSKRMRRTCSPPTQASFQAASTLVITLPSSTR